MLTVADPLKRALRVARYSTAVIDGEREFTFEAFDDRCRRLSGLLDSLGIQRGERVAILAGNCAPYLEAYVGVPACGRVVVPLNTRHAQPELEYALRDSGAKLLITDREPGPLSDCVEHIVSLNDDYEAALAAARPGPLGQGITENDLAGLFYTGGTTGKSKGVMLTHRNLIANTFHWLTAVPQDASDRMLIVAPLFHAAGSNAVLGNIWTGSCQLTLHSFDAESALDLASQHGATGTLAVPTMLAAMVEVQNKKPRDVSSLRFIAHGGSAMPVELLKRVHQAFPTASLVEVYGATELSPLATVFSGEQAHLGTPRVRSAGQATVGVDIDIFDTEGNSLPSGEVGEVVVRGPNVMKGYWNLPEQTTDVFKQGVYWTGDLGYLDEQGFLFLVDRSKDMIVSGGENVYSTEVEDVIYQHEAVLEAAVFGVPDEKWGEAVWAAVVPREGYDELDPEELIEFCRSRIAGYKLPKGIDLRQEPLPKSGPGKILKRELRATYEARKK